MRAFPFRVGLTLSSSEGFFLIRSGERLTVEDDRRPLSGVAL